MGPQDTAADGTSDAPTPNPDASADPGAAGPSDAPTPNSAAPADPDGAARPAGDTAAFPSGVTVPRGTSWAKFPLWVIGLIGVVAFILGGIIGRATAVPYSPDFWRIAAQPAAVIVGGLAAVSAAVVAFRAQRAASQTAFEGIELQIHAGDVQFAKTYAADVAQRNADTNSTDVNRCWEKFTWIVALHQGKDMPESGEVPVDVANFMLTSLYNDAKALGDQTLLVGIGEYSKLVVDNH